MIILMEFGCGRLNGQKMDSNEFIRTRIMQLVSSVDVNVVDIGPAIGKKKSDRSDISSGRMLPTFDSLNKRCAYFGISMSEFFDQQVDHPLHAKQMIAEYQRLCGNQTEPFLRILKTMDPSHMDAFLDLAKRISRSGNL